MLTYALARKDEVTKLLAEFEVSPEAIYFSPWCYLEAPKIEENSWSKLQLVAVHAGKVQGYLSATIDRSTQSIGNIAACKFCAGHELEFASDMARIFAFLRQHYRMIRWSVVRGAPTEHIYRRIALEQQGREVGCFIRDARLRDGQLADVVWFEVPGTSEPDCSAVLPAEWNK